MANILWTGQGSKTITIGNIINRAHLSYYNVKTNTGQLGNYSASSFTILKKDDNLTFSLNNDLPLASTNISYTITVKPTWYGDSKTYTEGNSKDISFQINQTNTPSFTSFTEPGVSLVGARDLYPTEIWSYYTPKGTPNTAGYKTGSAGNVLVSYTSTANAYNKTTKLTVDTISGAIVEHKTDAAIVTSTTNTDGIGVTLYAQDTPGKSVSTYIRITDPEFNMSNIISKGGKTIVSLSNIDISTSAVKWSVTNGSVFFENNTVYLKGDTSGKDITLTAYIGDNAIRGSRSIYIKVVDTIRPVVTFTSGNQGDTIPFSIKIGEVKLVGIGTDNANTVMTTKQIATAFTTTNCKILSCESDGTNWNGVIHLTGNGGLTANITANYVDGTVSSDEEGIKIEDITLTLS